MNDDDVTSTYLEGRRQADRMASPTWQAILDTGQDPGMELEGIPFFDRIDQVPTPGGMHVIGVHLDAEGNEIASQPLTMREGEMTAPETPPPNPPTPNPPAPEPAPGILDQAATYAVDIGKALIRGPVRGAEAINKLDPTGIMPAVAKLGGDVMHAVGIDTTPPPAAASSGLSD